MRIRLKHVKRFRARGRWYYYHRPTGTRLPDDPHSAEFVRRLAELDAQMVRQTEADPRGTLGALIAAYRTAPDFTTLRPRTRTDYGRYLDFLTEEIGVDWQTAESIIGHRTMEMARKYRAKKRAARIVIRKLDKATKGVER